MRGNPAFGSCRSSGPEVTFDHFDLLREGKQAETATDISAGDVCVVATQDLPREIVTFAWFKLSREENKRDKDGVPCRVFFGKRIKSEAMPKKKAAKAPLYSAYFNKRGHFEQRSVVPS